MPMKACSCSRGSYSPKIVYLPAVLKGMLASVLSVLVESDYSFRWVITTCIGSLSLIGGAAMTECGSSS